MFGTSGHVSTFVVSHMIGPVGHTLSCVDKAQAQAHVGAVPSDRGRLSVPYDSDDDVSASISGILRSSHGYSLHSSP